MIRKAFRMSLHKGFRDEYIPRHHPIWAELEQALLVHGRAQLLDLPRRDHERACTAC